MQQTATIRALHRLARNIWWTWNQDARGIFGELSPRTWTNVYHNPVAILREISETELKTRLMEPGYAKRVAGVLEEFDAYMNAPDTWTATQAPELAGRGVAYFSAAGNAGNFDGGMPSDGAINTMQYHMMFVKNQNDFDVSPKRM